MVIDQVKLTAPTPMVQRLTVSLKALAGASLSRLFDQTLRLHFHGATVKGMGREAYGLYALSDPATAGLVTAC